MASDTKKLAKYIVEEFVSEMQMGKSNEQLDKFAIALARAFDKYITTDVEVKTGIQVDSSFSTTTGGTVPGEDPVTTITKVKGKTVTTGKTF